MGEFTMLKYTLLKEDETYRVFLDGDLDIEGTEIINDLLIPELEKVGTVNIDFEKVPFVDSSGMGLLMSLVSTLKENNKKVFITNVSNEIYDIFDLLQLPEIVGKDVFI